MKQIDVAITRSIDDGEPLRVEEALTSEQALVAFTAGSAYINHCEESCGSLATGMLADLAVFDRDPFMDGPFRDAEVRMTMVGGDVVYEKT